MTDSFRRSADAIPAADPSHATSARSDGAAALPSDALLRGRSSIAIDHQGTRYVLRATRAGKLILTK